MQAGSHLYSDELRPQRNRLVPLRAEQVTDDSATTKRASGREDLGHGGDTSAPVSLSTISASVGRVAPFGTCTATFG